MVSVIIIPLSLYKKVVQLPEVHDSLSLSACPVEFRLCEPEGIPHGVGRDKRPVSVRVCIRQMKKNSV
jgi:hypothetical protein